LTSVAHTSESSNLVASTPVAKKRLRLAPPVRKLGSNNQKAADVRTRVHTNISPQSSVLDTLLHSSDSDLAQVDLKDIINVEVFENYLTSAEKDSLLHLLPVEDRLSLNSIHHFFRFNEHFHQTVLEFQQMLADGEFENSTQSDYLQYLRGKKRRETVDDPWKQKHYEEYWGQKKNELEDQNFETIVSNKEPPCPFSFIQEAKNKTFLGVLESHNGYVGTVQQSADEKYTTDPLKQNWSFRSTADSLGTSHSDQVIYSLAPKRRRGRPPKPAASFF